MVHFFKIVKFVNGGFMSQNRMKWEDFERIVDVLFSEIPHDVAQCEKRRKHTFKFVKDADLTSEQVVNMKKHMASFASYMWNKGFDAGVKDLSKRIDARRREKKRLGQP